MNLYTTSLIVAEILLSTIAKKIIQFLVNFSFLLRFFGLLQSSHPNQNLDRPSKRKKNGRTGDTASLKVLGCVHSWCWRGIFHWRECWANNLLAANMFYVHSCWPGQHPTCWAGQQAACWICWRAQHSRRSITYIHRSARLRSPHYCSLLIIK